jgi:phospholipid/cholesterol/gamma-HCH transport system ATP-binding protein
MPALQQALSSSRFNNLADFCRIEPRWECELPWFEVKEADMESADDRLHSTMIEFTDVSVRFGDRQVLKNISMTVPFGETLAILGGSGAGKTTILRLIEGLVQPDKGSIMIDGQEIVGLSEQRMTRVRNRMALVFQGSALFDSVTVRENVGYRLWEQGASSETTIEGRIAESLHFVGLDDIAEAMPAELSGGMKKRVAIARALASQPRLILYDEPTGGLDPINTHIIRELICRLHSKEHVTQVVVTHDVESAYQVADHLIMIHRGEKVFDGTVPALTASADERVQAFLHPDAGLSASDEGVHSAAR